MVIERFAKSSARVGGTGLGSTIGAFFNSPAVFGLAIVGILLVFFSGDIRKAFGSLGESISGAIPSFELPDISLPDITFPSFDFDFPEISFPDISFPEITLPNFDFLGGIFDDGSPPDLTDPANEGLIINEEGDLALPPDTSLASNLFDNIVDFFTPKEEEVIDTQLPSQDPQLNFPTLPPDTPLPFLPPIVTGIAPQIDESFTPPVELPVGFEGGGVSFEGGTIREISICNMSLGDIAAKFGISASAAADMKFQECEESDFDFGTNTGSGFGAGDDTSGGNCYRGGATLESEEKRAACLTCELFGLNCPICAGTI